MSRAPLPVAFASWSYPGLMVLFGTGLVMWVLIIYAVIALAF